MDWRTVRFDWNQARTFLVTAEEGSLTAAAKALGMTQPTAGRQIAALEERLGVTLFERRSSGQELTQAGLRLLEYARNMGAAASQFSLVASGQSLSLSGHICISATEMMAAFILPPLLIRLRQQYPELTVELLASNRASDLRRREADIAIRSFRPQQPDLIARKLRSERYGLYISQQAEGIATEELSNEAMNRQNYVGFEQSHQLLGLLNNAGLALTEQNFTMISDNALTNWELVRQGAGIGVMLEEIGDAEPAVRRVRPDIILPSTTSWLVSHRELRTSRRIRAVFDFLARELAR